MTSAFAALASTRSNPSSEIRGDYIYYMWDFCEGLPKKFYKKAVKTEDTPKMDIKNPYSYDSNREGN